MNELVADAARTLAALAGAGAGVAIAEASKEAGKDVHSAAKVVLGKIAGLLRRSDPDVTELAEALDAALAAGTVSEDELRSLVQQAGIVTSQSGNAVGNLTVNNTSKNAFINTVHNAPMTFD
jgi:hypothetical protein